MSPVPAVVVYVATGCHLCEAALEVVERVRVEIPFSLRVVDVAGDPAFEITHREHLPVVEIDGTRSFTYFVHPAALAERLRAGR